MDPLSAVRVWALSLVGIAALERPGPCMTVGTRMIGSFTESHARRGAMTRTVLPDVMMVAGAFALLAAVIALPLWW